MKKETSILKRKIHYGCGGNMKVRTTMYFHNSKEDSNYDFCELCKENGIKPTEEAESESCYAGYEVGVEVEWDLLTGKCEFIGLAK